MSLSHKMSTKSVYILKFAVHVLTATLYLGDSLLTEMFTPSCSTECYVFCFIASYMIS